MKNLCQTWDPQWPSALDQSRCTRAWRLKKTIRTCLTMPKWTSDSLFFGGSQRWGPAIFLACQGEVGEGLLPSERVGELFWSEAKRNLNLLAGVFDHEISEISLFF